MVNALFAVLAILGIVVDPTTEGVGDSAQPLLTRSHGNNKRPSPYGEGGFCFWARILQKKLRCRIIVNAINRPKGLLTHAIALQQAKSAHIFSEFLHIKKLQEIGISADFL